MTWTNLGRELAVVVVKEGVRAVEVEVDHRTAEANDVFGTPASLEPNGPCISLSISFPSRTRRWDDRSIE